MLRNVSYVLYFCEFSKIRVLELSKLEFQNTYIALQRIFINNNRIFITLIFLNHLKLTSDKYLISHNNVAKPESCFSKIRNLSSKSSNETGINFINPPLAVEHLILTVTLLLGFYFYCPMSLSH